MCGPSLDWFLRYSTISEIICNLITASKYQTANIASINLKRVARSSGVRRSGCSVCQLRVRPSDRKFIDVKSTCSIPAPSLEVPTCNRQLSNLELVEYIRKSVACTLHGYCKNGSTNGRTCLYYVYDSTAPSRCPAPNFIQRSLSYRIIHARLVDSRLRISQSDLGTAIMKLSRNFILSIVAVESEPSKKHLEIIGMRE